MKMILLLLAIVCGNVYAKDIIAEGQGFGATKNEALLQARREALATGIGQFLTSSTEVENFMVKRDFILTNTMGHVKSVQVLKEVQGADGVWEVRVRATVSQGGLSKDLASLLLLKESVGNPRIAVLIRETNIGNQDPTANKSEALLIDFFKSKQFEVVDPSAALRFRETPEGVQAMAGDPVAAARLGAEINAEVIIVGFSVAKESDVSNLPAFRNSSMKSASATVSLKAINVGNQRIMAAKSEDAPAIHVNAYTAGYNAIEKAINDLLGPKGNFFDALVESWRSKTSDGAIFQLTINGVDSFQVAKTIRSTLEGFAVKVDQRGFQRPQLRMDLTFVGNIEDLCTRLDGLKVGSHGSLQVESYQGSNVSLVMKK